MTTKRELAKLSRSGLAFALFLALAGANIAPVSAEGSGEAVRKMLDLMRAKGMLTPEEEREVLDALTADEARDRAAQQAVIEQQVEKKVAAAQPSAPPKPEYPRVRVVGRIQPRYTYVPSDDGVEGTNSLTARRMRLGAAGDLSANVGFNIVGEYANTDNRTQLLDAILVMRSLEDTIGHLMIGRAFIPAYINSASRTIAVERNFTQYLGPGQSGRAWGVGLGRGALYGRMGQGLFGDRLHYWAGIHNGSSGNTQNENNELLYSLRVDLMPNGPLQGDEWNLRRTPFRWGVGISGSYGNESSGQPDLDFNNAINGMVPDVSRLENRFMGAHAQFEGHGWFGIAQYQRLESEDADGSTPLVSAQGGLDSQLKSDAWLFGVSRIMGKGFAPGHQWGLGYQYQWIDNVHPFRTRFFGPRRNNLTAGTSALSFNEGSSYNLVLMYAAARNLRFHAEYDINDEKDSGVPDNNALTLQGVLDF